LREFERVELVRLRAEIKEAKSENAQLLMQVQFANYADDRMMPMFCRGAGLGGGCWGYLGILRGLPGT
jgi:hypothetical protein